MTTGRINQITTRPARRKPPTGLHSPRRCSRRTIEQSAASFLCYDVPKHSQRIQSPDFRNDTPFGNYPTSFRTFPCPRHSTLNFPVSCAPAKQPPATESSKESFNGRLDLTFYLTLSKGKRSTQRRPTLWHSECLIKGQEISRY